MKLGQTLTRHETEHAFVSKETCWVEDWSDSVFARSQVYCISTSSAATIFCDKTAASLSQPGIDQQDRLGSLHIYSFSCSS